MPRGIFGLRKVGLYGIRPLTRRYVKRGFMELRAFIKESIKDIMGGVYDAQLEIEYGEVVPKSSTKLSVIETGLTSIQAIDFEVSVNVVENAGSEAKLNVVAAVVNGGVKGNSSNSSGHTATLSFKVPVKMPVHNQSKSDTE
ncbi:hypothetical protein [Vibrio furnissii]|uniref:hypothetical protein n=1 Tax=Vibrio furnissii TaxID=29494 RepID=UPI0037510E20